MTRENSRTDRPCPTTSIAAPDNLKQLGYATSLALDFLLIDYVANAQALHDPALAIQKFVQHVVDVTIAEKDYRILFATASGVWLAVGDTSTTEGMPQPNFDDSNLSIAQFYGDRPIPKAPSSLAPSKLVPTSLAPLRLAPLRSAFVKSA